MCLETGVYWKYNLSEEKVKKTIRSRKSGDRNGLYIEVLELMGMVMAAYAMIVIRKGRTAKERESVLRRGDSSSAVQWVINCGGREREERSGGMTMIMGMLERMGRWSFQAKHVRAWRTL